VESSVKDCCRKYKAIRQPRNKCEACWDKYFLTNPGAAAALISAINKGLRQNVVDAAGTKFVKQFESFLERRKNASH
jgi:hypothetical protein